MILVFLTRGGRGVHSVGVGEEEVVWGGLVEEEGEVGEVAVEGGVGAGMEILSLVEGEG